MPSRAPRPFLAVALPVLAVVLATGLGMVPPASGTVTETGAATPAGPAVAGHEVPPTLVAPVRLPAPTPTDIGVDPAADRALADMVRRVAAVLGFSLPVSNAVRDARLPADVSGALATLLQDLLACHEISREAVGTDGPDRTASGAIRPLDPSVSEQLQSCAVRLHHDATAALPVIRDGLASSDGSGLDLWPVLRVARGDVDHVHDVDYLLLVDEAGDDHHLGNGGSNMVDLRRGHAPYALRPGPARGCEQVFPDTTSGGVERGPDGERQLSSDPGPECVITASLHLDLDGHDTYGRFEEPSFPDSQCTRDPVVRRIATQGVGFAGVGMLFDAAGDDAYLGKTLTQGAGHLAGVGILRDLEGNDRYLAIRSAQGMGLLNGLGLLVDQAGDDTYDHYMPRPIDPTTPDHADGAGGVNDDTGVGSEAGLGQHRDSNGELDGQPGGSCDRIARSLQGVGLLGAVGALVEMGGEDSYRAPAPEVQEFLRPLDGPAAVSFVHGSQGSGLFGGSGVLWDRGGHDTYLRSTDTTMYRDRGPSRTRENNSRSLPAFHPEAEPTRGGTVDAGVFLDE